MQYTLIARAGAEEFAVPSYATYSAFMSCKRAHQFALVSIPHLKKSWVGADSQMISSVWPLHTSYRIILTEIVEFCNLTWSSRPKIDARAQTHCKHVCRRPIHKVEIEIVLEGRSVKNLEWNLWDLSLLLVWCRQKLIFFEACKWCHHEGRWMTQGVSFNVWESENIIGGRWSKWEGYGPLYTADCVHELIIKITSLYQMRVLHSKHLVLKKSCVHSLIFISLLSRIRLSNLILLIHWWMLIQGILSLVCHESTLVCVKGWLSWPWKLVV